MPKKNNAVAYDWDSTISNKNEKKVLLNDGNYNFKVIGFERGYFNGSDKMIACPKANLTLNVETDDGVAKIKTTLFLCSSYEKKIASFFRSIDSANNGDTINMDWSHILGSEGIAHFRVKNFTDRDGIEHQYNEVAFFIDKSTENDDLPF